ncbi:hypothetical protein AAVH_24001 [Aphelenchoides avenae]|nr:hypothetical protein AAVH_24001 [Aphelenchus avenae]
MQPAQEFFNGVNDFTQALSAAIPQSGCVTPAQNADEFCRVSACIWNKVYNYMKPNYDEQVAAWVGIVQKLSYAINQNDRHYPGPIPQLCYNWIFGPGAGIEHAKLANVSSTEER